MNDFQRLQSMQRNYWSESGRLLKKTALFATYAGLSGAVAYGGVQLLRANNVNAVIDIAQNCVGIVALIGGGGACVGYAIGALYVGSLATYSAAQAMLMRFKL